MLQSILSVVAMQRYLIAATSLMYYIAIYRRSVAIAQIFRG